MADAAFDRLPRHDVALVIAGRAYLGWTDVDIDRGIDSLVGSFTLSLAAKDKTAATDFVLAEGDACELVLGGAPIITGWIDTVERYVDKEDRRISVTGRDKACDLVDCSALNKPGSWTNAKLEKIAQDIADPFKVKLTIEGSTGAKLAKFALQPGETAWAAIERLARYRGLIAFSDGRGGVKIGNPDSGKRSGRLKFGHNLKAVTTARDNTERFSHYVVKGQASGNDKRHGKAVAQVKAEASDAGVKRYRPLLIVGEEQSDAASLKKRAAWEATVRAGKGETVTAIVPGWFAGDGAKSGPVWEPGARAECDVPSHGLSGDRLIERVRLRRSSEDGTIAELILRPPAAWTQLAEKEAKV